MYYEGIAIPKLKTIRGGPAVGVSPLIASDWLIPNGFAASPGSTWESLELTQSRETISDRKETDIY